MGLALLSLTLLQVTWWDGRDGIRMKNSAVYCDGGAVVVVVVGSASN